MIEQLTSTENYCIFEEDLWWNIDIGKENREKYFKHGFLNRIKSTEIGTSNGITIITSANYYPVNRVRDILLITEI